MKNLLLGAVVLLGACGLSETKFNDQFGSTLCEKSNECLTAEGLDGIDCNATVEDVEEVEAPDCEFDAAKATECLDGLETAECEGAVLSTPSACGQVFSNCAE